MKTADRPWSRLNMMKSGRLWVTHRSHRPPAPTMSAEFRFRHQYGFHRANKVVDPRRACVQTLDPDPSLGGIRSSAGCHPNPLYPPSGGRAHGERATRGRPHTYFLHMGEILINYKGYQLPFIILVLGKAVLSSHLCFLMHLCVH